MTDVSQSTQTATQENQGQFFVKTLTGKSIVFDLNEQMTVEQLKIDIERLEKIPVEQQRLIYQGKQLEDAQTLGDYNITNEASIHLILRLRG